MSDNQHRVILVPTDFSETCQNAINHAVHLAKIGDQTIVLLHVINKDTRARLKKEGKGIETIVARLESLRQEILESNIIEIEIIAREGSIYKVIDDVASQVKANLMILGTHGKHGLQYLFGSFAFKVITESPCPVYVVQEKTKITDCNKVLFPVNIYTEPRQQVPLAKRVAKFFDSEFIVFKQKFSDRIAVSKLEIITKQILTELNKSEIKYEIVSAEKQKDFTGQLLDYVSSENIDMIIMMTDSRLQEPDFNSSAWSEKLIYNEANVGVLCINPVYLDEIYYF